MRTIATIICVTLAAAAATTASAGAYSYLRVADDQQIVEFKHKSDMPPGVLAALGFDMADAGEPFRATDVVTDKSLPFRRFILARQVGDTFTIEYEKGGIAHTFETAVVRREGDKYVLSP